MPQFSLRVPTAHLRFEMLFDELSNAFVPHEGYTRDTSPRFWAGLFFAHFGNEPLSAEDPRWEELFTLRYPRRRSFNALHT